MADEAADGLIEVEVVYALAGEQIVYALRVPAGTSVGEAIARSGVLARYPEIETRTIKAGILGRRAPLAAPLHEHDRVEIYRALIADPKQARRARARRTAKTKR